MTSKVSTLTVSLKDDVSGPAGAIGKALKGASDQARAMGKAMEGTGASKGFVNNLARLGLSAKDIEKVSASLKDYAKAAGLAGDASTWTKDQTAQIRQWETATIASLRHVAAEQKTVAKGALDVAAAMARSSAITAQGRRVADGMGAPSRAAALRREAAALALVEARTAALVRANERLASSMGRASAITAGGRLVADGMSAPARAARAERERAAQATADARAAARAERREAAGIVAAGAGVYAGHKSRDLAKSAITSAAEFDLAVRKQKVFTDISHGDQAGLLAQAKRIGQETQFSNIDVVKAQTAAMQGLPAGFAPSLKAAVAEGIVQNVRNFSTLMETDLKEGTEIIRSYLQQAGKDISTKEKALFEANKATNQLVKMAKLGGMDGEDVKNYANYAIASGTASGLSTDALMTLGALARRGGLRGDVAGVAVRSMASKIVAPTRDGIAALNAAGIKHSDYVKMPDRLSTEALEGQFQNTMGKGFTPAIRKRIEAINTDKALIADRGKYVEAVTDAVSPMLGKTKKGTVRASDAKVAAKAAGAYYKVAGASVDAEGLLDAAMSKNMTLPQLNAWLTDKHGGKGAITQKQWDEFKAAREQIKGAADDPDWAKKKADEVFAGLGGAVENLKGSFENLILTIGNANAGLIKWSADGLGSILDGFSKLPEVAQQALSLSGVVAATVAGAWGTLKLLKTAVGLAGGAGAAGAGAAGAAAGAAGGAAGKAASQRMIAGMGGGAVEAATSAGAAAAGAVVAGVAVGGAVASAVATEAVKNREFADPYLSGGMLGADPAGYGFGAAIVHAPDLIPRDPPPINPRAIPSMMGHGMHQSPGGAGSGTSGFGLSGPQSAPAIAPRGDDAGLRQVHASAEQLKQALDQLNGVSVTPQANAGPLEALAAKAREVLSLLQQIPGAAASANASAIGGIRARGSAASFQGPDYAGP
ncbi:hypothetical protein NBEOAGPD_1238 [Methylobacterium gregans]|uniref:Phage tail tape measure protein domain-containing protein n=1 Tax=Methylobacterium gregans TaxID=374424 RepID=A0AA37HMB5_9HYPH|nr:phage tail tape measure protein [Methylobacterium gregans]MDQ0521940.1 TP901 family phage tail tape measure protein [Methylobacterium gregans]GJD78026.1 hypothetical protein NBEOAGPD_1238 [Methylobacterium gregans]